MIIYLSHFSPLFKTCGVIFLYILMPFKCANLNHFEEICLLSSKQKYLLFQHIPPPTHTHIHWWWQGMYWLPEFLPAHKAIFPPAPPPPTGHTHSGRSNSRFADALP